MAIGLASRVLARRLFYAAVLVSIVTPAGAIARAQSAQPAFYLHDGDTVVFYGDSITEQRRFTEYTASYCITREPTWRLTFINSGWGFETVDGGPGGDVDTRLDRDVTAYRPTVVVICLGANDAGNKPFNRPRFDRFVGGYRHILETLTKSLPTARLTLLSPPSYDDYTRPRTFSGGVNGVLQKYDEGIEELAKEYGATYVDCNKPLAWFLRAANRNAPSLAQSLLPDRIHPRSAGHVLIAAALLKAWHAWPTALDAVVDVADGSAIGAHVSDIKSDPASTSFTLNDCLSPWPIDRDPKANPDVSFLLRSTRIEQDLNVCRVAVKGLAPGTYSLAIDGTSAGRFTGDEIGRGIDLAGLKTPLAYRAQKILDRLRCYDHLHFDLWRNVEIQGAANGDSYASILVHRGTLLSQETQAWGQALALCRPSPHRFTLRRLE